MKTRRSYTVAALLAAIGAAVTVAVTLPPRPEAQGAAAEKLEGARQPDEDEAVYAQERQPGGHDRAAGAAATPLDPERYVAALRQADAMPRLVGGGRLVVGKGAVAAPPWTALGPHNVGGRTRALVFDPSDLSGQTLYAAGVGGGVWKSTDGGANWLPTGGLVPNIRVSTLAMDPANSSVLYAGTGEIFSGGNFLGAGIFKTMNGGATWVQITATKTPDFQYVNKIVVSPNDSSRVYAAASNGNTRTGGVWLSTDGGASWIKTLSPKKGEPLDTALETVFNGDAVDLPGGCTDLVVRAGTSADRVVASCGINLGYGSADGAALYYNLTANSFLPNNGGWVRAYSEAGMDRTSLAISPSDQNVMYALAASHEADLTRFNGMLAVLKSTNGGQSWTATVRNTSATPINRRLLSDYGPACYGGSGYGQGTYDNTIAVDPVNSNRVWVGGIDLFRSDDGGANFGLAFHYYPPHPDLHAFAFPPRYDGVNIKSVYVASDGGIYTTPDATAATKSDPCDFSTGEMEWTAINNGYQTAQFYHGSVYPDGTRTVGGTQDNGMLRNRSGTTTWDGLGLGGVIGGDAGYSAVDPTNTNVLFVSDKFKYIQKSTDGGSTYSRAMSGISDSFLSFAPFNMAPSNPQILWTGGSYLWRTTDQAGSWVRASAIVPGLVKTIAVAANDPNTVLVGTTDGYILRSTGALSTTATTNWDKVLLCANCAVSSLAFNPSDARIAYATVLNFGAKHIWKTTDGGATWSSLDGSSYSSLPDVPVTSVVLNPNNPDALMLGSDIGIFVSLDAGASWATANAGIGNAPVMTLAYNAATSRIFAFTHGLGAWSFDASFLDALPAAPANLTATAGNGQVTLNWAASAGASTYNVYQGTSAGGEGTTPVATGITGTTRTVAGLTNGTTYYFKVAAINASGTSPLSNEASATPADPPPAPTNLTATPGNSQVTLNWGASDGATSYNVYQGTSAGGATLVATGVTGTNRTVTGLTNGTTYFFKVAAINAGGASSPFSNAASATPQGPPPAPTNLSATAGNGQVTLNWAASTGATSYNVYQGTSAGAETLLATGIAGTGRIVTGLSNGTTYYFKVAAVNANGTSPLSNEASATPQGAPPAPTNLTATAGDSQVTLNWTASTGASSYNVYQGTSAGGETLAATGITGTSRTVTGLTNGTTYFFKVAAVNPTGVSALSNGASATPQGATQGTPPAPTNLTASASSGQVVVQWTASTGASSYRMFMATAPGGEDTTTPVWSGSGTLGFVSGLTNGTTYYFKVAAVNASGAGPLSSEASATPSGPPPAPTNLTATAGNGQVTLNWTASAGAARYGVYRGTTSGGTTFLLFTASGTSRTVTGLTNGTTYYFTVTAANENYEESPRSNEASATPVATARAQTETSDDEGGGGAMGWAALLIGLAAAVRRRRRI
ncbi:MAG: fibronectin type III domain-containing protein [Sinimarinibacterium sp.]|jgi:MYXO-CTERM domain-containing protein